MQWLKNLSTVLYMYKTRISVEQSEVFILITALSESETGETHVKQTRETHVTQTRETYVKQNRETNVKKQVNTR